MIRNYTDSAAMAALDVASFSLCSSLPLPSVDRYAYFIAFALLFYLLHMARLFDPAVVEYSGIMACPLLQISVPL